MKKNKLLKPYYLLLLAFPVLFFLLYKPETPIQNDASLFQFYTSIKTNSPIQLELTNNNKSLQKWQGPNNHYKQIDFVGTINPAANKNLKLKINNAKAGDTISFLAINFLLNNRLYSLSAENFKYLTTTSNVKIIDDERQLKLLILSNSQDSWLQFNNIENWQSDTISKFKYIVISVILFCLIIIVLIINPERKWFLTSFVMCFCSMFFYWWVGLDSAIQLTISPLESNKQTVFYFNNVPQFNENLKSVYNDSSSLRKFQTTPSSQKYYRIDFADDKENLGKINIKYEAGLIKKIWELNSVEPFKIIGNDIEIVNNNYILKGEDPYLAITSTYFINGMQKVLFVRSTVYLLLTLLLFIILLLLQKWFSSYSAAAIILFLFFYNIIISAFCFSFFNAQRLVLEDEKRLAAVLPDFEIKHIKEYAQGLSAYIKDQYPGKSRLTTLNNLIRYKTFGDISNNYIVHFGKKGWMFYTGENVKDVYENKNLYTDAELKRMKEVLEERNSYMESLGIKYYILFPRMSHYFYQEYVGATLHTYNKKAKLEQFLEYMKTHSKVKIIDIYTSMKIAKDTSKRDLYYHEDSHWNFYGAYFAYAEIINTIRKDFPNMPKPIPMNEIKWTETDNEEGDLPMLLSLNKYIKRHEYLPFHDRVNCAYMIPAPDYPEYQSVHKMVFFQGNNNAMPKLIMNRDSYTNYLISYFGSHFSRQGYLWSPIFFPGIIKTEKPDIVITEMMERFLSDLLVNNPPIPKADSTAAIK